MPYLNKQIGIINSALEEHLSADRFSGVKVDGLAYPCVREEADGNQILPAVLFENKVNRYIDLDDTYPMGLYHRVLGNSYKAANTNFGDGTSKLVKVTRMVMVVYGKTSRIKMRPEDLEAFMVSIFPSNIAGSLIAPLKLNKMMVEITSSNMNGLAVFQSEYRNVKYFLGPEDILFQIEYKVTSHFNRNCFALCDCD